MRIDLTDPTQWVSQRHTHLPKGMLGGGRRVAINLAPMFTAQKSRLCNFETNREPNRHEKINIFNQKEMARDKIYPENYRPGRELLCSFQTNRLSETNYKCLCNNQTNYMYVYASLQTPR